MVQSSLVLQLQELAADNNCDITELLRKALVVATKLDLQDFRDWINFELYGYKSDKIPDYRLVHTNLRLRDPTRGFIPFLIEDQNEMNSICNVHIKVSVSSLNNLLNNSETDEAILQVPLPHNLKLNLIRLQDEETQFEPFRFVATNQIAAILDQVRTKVLEWSLDLEKNKIVGDGLTFSTEEKQIAQSVITIQNFQGILGDVSESNVSQSLNMTVKKGDFDSLREFLTSKDVDAADIDDLENAINLDSSVTQPDSFGENVGQWIGKMATKSARGLWSVGIGAAGNLLAQAINAFYGF